MNSSCTILRWYKYDSPKIRDFKNQIIKEHKNIKYISVKYTVPVVRINIILDNNISNKEIVQIFYKTKNFFIDNTFKNEFFKTYFKRYDDIKVAYPVFEISFNINNDNKIDYEFESFYYKNSSLPGKNKKIDAYKTWYYLDRKTGEYIKLPDKLDELYKLNFLE